MLLQVSTPGGNGLQVVGAPLVQAATVKDATLQNADVQACLTTKVRGLVFPKPRGGGVVVVNYPFAFRAK